MYVYDIWDVTAEVRQLKNILWQILKNFRINCNIFYIYSSFIAENK